ncbi:MAG TPA: hypothetical protein VKS22_15885 [Candidatus Binataceae bacterium]|nr:hypothetical protein [Candidatus Binataceae bacterium]
MQQKFSDEALRVLDVLGEKASDGYAVMSKAGLKPDELVRALKELPTYLVMVKGELIPDRVGDAYLVLLPNARDYANSLVRSLA